MACVHIMTINFVIIYTIETIRTDNIVIIMRSGDIANLTRTFVDNVKEILVVLIGKI